MSLKPYQLYTVVSISCLALLGVWLKMSEDEQNTQKAKQSSEQELSKKRSRTPSKTTDWENIARTSFSSGESTEFSKKISTLNIDGLFDLSQAIRKNFEDDPAAAAAWLEDVSLTMAGADQHEQAAQLLNFLSLTKEIPAIERKLYYDWLQSGDQGPLEMISKNIETKESYEHQLSLLGSMMQNEFPERLEGYIASIEASEYGLLKGVAIEKLVTHLKPENTDLVAELISRIVNNSLVAASLYHYIDKHSPEDRIKTLDWVAELPADSYRLKADLLGNVIQQVAREDVDQAIDLLNSETFLTKYYPSSDEAARTPEGDWSPSAQLFFDVTLKSFIKGAMHSDLELAKNSVDSFFSPALREQYKKTIDEFVAIAEARQKNL